MMAGLCRMPLLASGTSFGFSGHNPGGAPVSDATRPGEKARTAALRLPPRTALLRLPSVELSSLVKKT